MDPQTPLRVGIIGCGYQGGILAQTIATGNAGRPIAAWRVVACADPDQAAAARVAAIAGGAATYASTEELLGTEVDAVFVATSHDALYECSLAAVQAGKHVMAEKPIGHFAAHATIVPEGALNSAIDFSYQRSVARLLFGN